MRLFRRDLKEMAVFLHMQPGLSIKTIGFPRQRQTFLLLQRFSKSLLRIMNITCTERIFFETKDFFKFNTSSVPDAIKNIWAGIYSPRLYLVPRCIIGSGDDIAEASKRIRLGLARKLVFIEEDLPQRYSHLKTSLKNLSSIENPELGKIKVRHYNPNELALEVDSKQDCFLYYGDGYDKSWRGFIDGKEDKVYKANLAFKAIIVPRGNHEVRFLYDPKFYKVSLFCYFVGMLVLVAVSIKTTIAYFKGKAVRR